MTVVYRPNKTKEDQMPVNERPRVIAAQKRREKMQQERPNGLGVRRQ